MIVICKAKVSSTAVPSCPSWTLPDRHPSLFPLQDHRRILCMPLRPRLHSLYRVLRQQDLRWHLQASMILGPEHGRTRGKKKLSDTVSMTLQNSTSLSPSSQSMTQFLSQSSVAHTHMIEHPSSFSVPPPPSSVLHAGMIANDIRWHACTHQTISQSIPCVHLRHRFSNPEKPHLLYPHSPSVSVRVKATPFSPYEIRNDASVITNGYRQNDDMIQSNPSFSPSRLVDPYPIIRIQ